MLVSGTLDWNPATSTDLATGMRHRRNLAMRDISAPAPLPAVRAVKCPPLNVLPCSSYGFEQLSYEAAVDRLAVPLADLKENLLSARRLIMARLQ
jgi:hypothetical protein